MECGGFSFVPDREVRIVLDGCTERVPLLPPHFGAARICTFVGGPSNPRNCPTVLLTLRNGLCGEDPCETLYGTYRCLV